MVWELEGSRLPEKAEKEELRVVKAAASALLMRDWTATK
jgi:hypothetical protein